MNVPTPSPLPLVAGIVAAMAMAQAAGSTLPEVTDMAPTTIQLLREWGVAGAVAIVAIVMFWFYRKDLSTTLAGAERREDRLVEVVDRNSAAMSKLSEKLDAFLKSR